MGIKFLQYRLTIIHALGDVIIPCSSFSAKIKHDSPSYLQVVIPYTATRLSQINDRATSGTIRIDKVYSDNSTELVTYVDLEDIRFDEGTSNKSITITGHRTYLNTNPGNLYITEYSYIRQASDISVRTTPYYSPQPRDRIHAGSRYFIAGAITYNVSVSNQTIEIAEDTEATTTSTTSSSYTSVSTTSSVTTTTTTEPP